MSLSACPSEPSLEARLSWLSGVGGTFLGTHTFHVMFLSSALKEAQCCLACLNLCEPWACHCLWWTVLFHPASSLLDCLWDLRSVTMAGAFAHIHWLQVWVWFVSLWTYWYVIGKECLLLKCRLIVPVFRQGKLSRRTFQTQQINFPDLQAIHVHSTWFCHECWLSAYSVRTSIWENLVGNEDTGDLWSWPIQPFSHLYWQHKAFMCLFLLKSPDWIYPPEIMTYQ